jgi:hypothetical protein
LRKCEDEANAAGASMANATSGTISFFTTAPLVDF